MVLACMSEPVLSEVQKIGPSDKTINAYKESLKGLQDATSPENRYKEKAGKMNAFVKSEDFKKKTEMYKNRLKTLSPELFGEAPEPQEQKKDNYFGKDRIYIFISSSVPKSTLRQYINDIDGLPQATAVLNGFIGDIGKMQPTVQFIADLLKVDEHCKMPGCDYLDSEIVVDPIIFKRLNIDRVPAIAYVENYERIGYCSEGLETGSKMSNIRVVYGDVALKDALEHINKKTKSAKLASIIKKL